MVSNAKNMNPRSIANSSGFPLQIRLSDLTRSTSQWKVLFEELPWQAPDETAKGFIDLVILNTNSGFLSMVIECKRVRQTEWVFLIPKPMSSHRSHAKLWCSTKSNSSWSNFGWQDWQTEPMTYESKFCAIPGQAHGKQTLLERTCWDLIESVEALALQEKRMTEGMNERKFMHRLYIPVVVTTAKLKIARFDPKEISLKEGDLSKDVEFESVPYLRFRKTLSYIQHNFFEDRSHNEAFQDTERTVFVVNSESFYAFIESFETRS